MVDMESVSDRLIDLSKADVVSENTRGYEPARFGMY